MISFLRLGNGLHQSEYGSKKSINQSGNHESIFTLVSPCVGLYIVALLLIYNPKPDNILD